MRQLVSIFCVLVLVVAIEQTPPQGLSAQEEVAALRGGGSSSGDRDPALSGGVKPVDQKELSATHRESPEVAAKPSLPKTITVDGKAIELAPLLDEKHPDGQFPRTSDCKECDLEVFLQEKMGVAVDDLAKLNFDQKWRLLCGLQANLRLDFATGETFSDLTPKAHDYGCDTYPVRARGYTPAGAALFPKGSCVSVGKGRFLTAAHIFTGLQAGYVVEVSVGGEWQKVVTFSADAKSDFAELTIAKTDIEGVEPRKVKFGEKVTAYGLTTCEPMHGVYVGDKHVGLDQETNGIDFGDSGGGVYGEDGALVGLISGLGDDRRSVYIAPVVKAEKQVAQANAPPPPAEPKVSAPPQIQSCPNGQCQRVQVPQVRFFKRGR